MSSDVELRSLGKRFGAATVLEDVSLRIEPGEFVALVGPSGCGKSTLLRVIAGLEEITSGDLLVGGRRINDLRPQDRNIAMVFQSYALFPHLSTRDNIGYGPRIRREEPGRARQAIAGAAQTLGLTALLDRKPAQLSGGQRQRVAMGRAILREPDLFLFDEPLSNLDAQLRVHMRAEIKAMHRRMGRTTIYVTHDQTEAMTMADRVVVLRAGRIEQEGPPLDLYDRPANTFVASFIGSPSMTMLPARTEGSRLRLPDGADLGPIPATLPNEVTLGIRPEAFRRDPAGPIAFAVDLVEATGAETHLIGRIAGHPARVLLRDRLRVSPGETVPLSAAASDLHLFDPESGARL
jgi:multiple sugar transport system ATP-binding protein